MRFTNATGRHSARRRVPSVVLVAACLARAPVAGAQTLPNEYRLKAAFVYQFSQFVEWPPAAWQGAASVQLCVTRPNPFGRELDALVAGELLNGRPFTVREVETPAAIAGCHVLFVGRAASRSAELLRAAARAPVLTVGEEGRFLEDGGIILLRVVDRRVRFDVSVSAAQNAGVRISAQLLRLAVTVRGGPS